MQGHHQHMQPSQRQGIIRSTARVAQSSEFIPSFNISIVCYDITVPTTSIVHESFAR
jgi:hypothetical protein